MVKITYDHRQTTCKLSQLNFLISNLTHSTTGCNMTYKLCKQRKDFCAPKRKCTFISTIQYSVWWNKRKCYLLVCLFSFPSPQLHCHSCFPSYRKGNLCLSNSEYLKNLLYAGPERVWTTECSTKRTFPKLTLLRLLTLFTQHAPLASLTCLVTVVILIIDWVRCRQDFLLWHYFYRW
jgi:hypothetical protein